MKKSFPESKVVRFLWEKVEEVQKTFRSVAMMSSIALFGGIATNSPKNSKPFQRRRQFQETAIVLQNIRTLSSASLLCPLWQYSTRYMFFKRFYFVCLELEKCVWEVLKFAAKIFEVIGISGDIYIVNFTRLWLCWRCRSSPPSPGPDAKAFFVQISPSHSYPCNNFLENSACTSSHLSRSWLWNLVFNGLGALQFSLAPPFPNPRAPKYSLLYLEWNVVDNLVHQCSGILLYN